MFIKKFSSGPIQTNAILLACEKTGEAAVIDPSKNSTKAILKEVQEQGFTVEKILLTHSHWDHIADVHILKEMTGAPVYIHELDAENLRKPGSDQLKAAFEIEGLEPTGFLEEGQIVEVGTLKVHVIHTPGHSPGCICFYIPEEGVLIAGDTLFKGTYGALHLATGQPRLMRNSLNKLANLPANTRVIPGHGADTTIGDEKQTFEGI